MRVSKVVESTEKRRRQPFYNFRMAYNRGMELVKKKKTKKSRGDLTISNKIPHAFHTHYLFD